jgi:hypothetical protein
MCEGCGIKQPHFGSARDRKKRWCGGCAKQQDDAVSLNKMCESCGRKQPSFGSASDRKKRWCGGCAKQQDDAVNLTAQQMCEGCGLKHANFGSASDRKRRWCGGCAKQQNNAVSLKAQKMCESCGEKHANYTITHPGRCAHTAAYCASCAHSRVSKDEKLRKQLAFIGGSALAENGSTGYHSAPGSNAGGGCQGADVDEGCGWSQPCELLYLLNGRMVCTLCEIDARRAGETGEAKYLTPAEFRKLGRGRKRRTSTAKKAGKKPQQQQAAPAKVIRKGGGRKKARRE